MDNRHLWRGKRLDNGEWVQGWYSPFDGYTKNGEGNRYCITNGMFAKDIYEVDPATAGQCTGLVAAKSYRGDSEEDRLIFERDICKATFGSASYLVFVVEWEKEARFLGFTIERERRIIYINRDPVKVEIIGIVQDNPELLEVGNDQF